MQSEFNNLYFGISKNGFVLLQLDMDYSSDITIINLIKSYKKVAFGDNFNQPIDYLPDGITDLYLGQRFNKPINNLPQSLKKLKISSNIIAYTEFNQSLDNLPSGLETIDILINKSFNQPIDNLPISLKKLVLICQQFKQPINNLPCNLEELVIYMFDYENTHYLPGSLKNFNFKYNFDSVEITNKVTNIIRKNLVNKYPNILFLSYDTELQPLHELIELQQF